MSKTQADTQNPSMQARKPRSIEGVRPEQSFVTRAIILLPKSKTPETPKPQTVNPRPQTLNPILNAEP